MHKKDLVINNKENGTLVNKELSYYERVSLQDDYIIPESEVLNILKNFQNFNINRFEFEE